MNIISYLILTDISESSRLYWHIQNGKIIWRYWKCSLLLTIWKFTELYNLLCNLAFSFSLLSKYSMYNSPRSVIISYYSNQISQSSLIPTLLFVWEIFLFLLEMPFDWHTYISLTYLFKHRMIGYISLIYLFQHRIRSFKLCRLFDYNGFWAAGSLQFIKWLCIV
jgi:hypothetical protein